uniref:Pentatricopeptide repeat-containing protein n=1 Tax=Kalanchoe fedtschenkoi TaxID=63787 RepID=A0A7N0RIU7_KALFE
MSLARLIQVCGEVQCPRNVRAVHARIVTCGVEQDVFTNNHLISAYFKCHRVKDGRQLFDRMSKRNAKSWTALVYGYTQMGMTESVFQCIKAMVSDGFNLDYFSYVAAVSACASLGAARTGKEIHGRIYRMELELNSHVSNCLINMYGKCAVLEYARRVFDMTVEPNTVAWTSMISGYCQSGDSVGGFKIFSKSRNVGLAVNEFSCASVLAACAALEDLRMGMQVHCLAVKSGIRFDEYVVTCLINLYAKCGKLDLAQNAFEEAEIPHFSAWTALIGGFAQHGHRQQAIAVFARFLSLGLKPNEMTFAYVLGAAADASWVKVGEQLHAMIIKLGYASATLVGNAVLDFYSKCKLLDESSKAFLEICQHDTVSWNTLISGRVKSGCHGEVVELLTQMMREEFAPNLYTYSSILSFCGDLPALQWGRQTHCCILKPGFDSDVVVGSSLIDMYAKCGRLDDAHKTFDNLGSKNLVSWNTMLTGYAQHGFGYEALDLYELMQQYGVKPSSITFIGVLSACSHVGLVEKGLQSFDCMTKEYKIAPKVDHIACMVNLFARSGQTKRAYDFIKSFKTKPDKIVWRCLLSGCRTHKDLDLGRVAAENILSIDPHDTSAYVMLSNIFSDARMWKETADVRILMKEKALKKDPGYSWIELQHGVYCFTTTQFHGSNVQEILWGLTDQLFDAGYVQEKGGLELHFNVE